jgi:hypothetical protein
MREYRICVLLFFVTFSTLAQKNFRGIIKTNIATLKPIQQYSLSLETVTNYPKQTNCYMIGGHILGSKSDPSIRKAFYLAYKRKFYMDPVFTKNNIYISPYSKIIFRDVNEIGDGFITGDRNFSSMSIAVGGDLGVNFNLSKRVLLGFMGGMGVGFVVGYTNRQAGGYENPTMAHLDMHSLVEIGLKF